MEIEVRLTTAELQEAVLAWQLAKGFKFDSGAKLTVVMLAEAIATTQPQPQPQPPAPPTPSRAAVAALIGHIVNGVKVTHYGYPGDSSPDSSSMAGKGDRGNKLTPEKSAALTQSQRQEMFGQGHPSTGKEFQFENLTLIDDDTAPEGDRRVDIYDPFYTGRDPGCTDEMYAHSRAEMVAAGILQA